MLPACRSAGRPAASPVCRPHAQLVHHYCVRLLGAALDGARLAALAPAYDAAAAAGAAAAAAAVAAALAAGNHAGAAAIPADGGVGDIFTWAATQPRHPEFELPSTLAGAVGILHRRCRDTTVPDACHPRSPD